MTEKQAWRTIAEAYATPRWERSRKQRELTYCGICYAIKRLFRKKSNVSQSMRKEIYQDLDSWPDWFGFFCRTTPENDKLRADYCYLQYFMLGGK